MSPRSGLTFIFVSVFSLAVAGCMPPQEGTETPVQEPVPVDSNGIPWAPGEQPDDHASTTREVSEGPKVQEERPDHYYEGDGIQQANSAPATCNGRATPALRAAVDFRAGETHACYDKLPAERAGAKGDLKVSIKITQRGEVSEVKTLSDSLSVPEVTSCVEDVLKAPFQDAKPRGGCAVFVIPIHLESEESQSGNATEKGTAAGAAE